MRQYLIALTLFTLLFCGLFTSDENRNVVSASNSCDHNRNVVGLFEVIKKFFQQEKMDTEVVLGTIESIANSLADLQKTVLKMELREASRCSNLALKQEERHSKNCAEIELKGGCSFGVQTVYPFGNSNNTHIDVFCDQTTDEGGWTVIQSRSPGPVRERFERGWQEYVQGFGDLNGEFWLGLENIHALTNSTPMELRIDLENYEGEKRYAKYEGFHVGDAASKYVLTIGNYSGDAGDAMWNTSKTYWKSNGMMFSTSDQDNDHSSSTNCALKYRGAWWFNGCHEAHLNGFPYIGEHGTFGDGINWDTFRGAHYSLKKASMKIRPVYSWF